MEVMKEEQKRKAVLCSIYPQNGEYRCMTSLEELQRLLETAGGESVAFVTQQKEKPDNATYFGSGKLNEIKEMAENLEADLIIVDDELSPLQIRNIEVAVEFEVIDRSMLILDIFALHAVSAEGRLQVELAQLRYTAPRLQGSRKELSRLGGGIGTRGPGESKLEIDRRRSREKIAILEERLRQLEKSRAITRANRLNDGIKKCAIVGYTNAGKSTLLNYLTGAGVLSEDKLFATLDPTTRMLTMEDGTKVYLTDTVGFVHKLPHHLIKAFKSTLDEAIFADMLLILCDSADPNFLLELEVTENLLVSLGVSEKPTIYVFNKCDVTEQKPLLEEIKNSLGNSKADIVFISAKTGAGIPCLLEKMSAIVHAGKQRATYLFPLEKGDLLSLLYKNGDDVHVEYKEEGILADGLVDEKLFNQLKEYLSHLGLL